MRKTFGWSSVALLALGLLASVPASAISPVMTCSNVTGISLPGTQILSATEKKNPVPHCAVVGIINQRVSTQDPDHFTYGIGFQVNLPDSWVGRFEMMGGSGTDGSLPYPLGSAGFELSEGWVVAADDGGHEDTPNAALGGYSDDDDNSGGPSHFGVDDQARLDYGYNGIVQTTTVAKQLIADYYGQGPQYSYFWGCSNGGRDAIVAAHRLADDYDGIVAGNPGFDLPRASIAEHWNEQALVPLSKKNDANGSPFVSYTLQPQDLEVASAAILQACDALDGLADGIIDNYPQCTTARVNAAFANFTCTSSSEEHNGTCLTTAQIAAINQIMAGPENSEGTALYSSWYWDAGIWDPAAAQGFHFWDVAKGTGASTTNTAHNLTLGAGSGALVYTTPPVPLPVSGTDSLESFVFSYDFDTTAETIFQTAPGYSQSAMQFMTGSNWGESPDLEEYKSHGGKLIIYSSINDGIFSGADIVNYYSQIDLFFGGASDFARLFLVPNMAHCKGGPATESFKQTMFDAITGWTETGAAPSQIVAANTDTTSPFPSGGLFNPSVAVNFPTNGTRPLCPYPQQTRYSGKGSTHDASNFYCFIPSDDAGSRTAESH
jgi:Tannase and feruloyl esterase